MAEIYGKVATQAMTKALEKTQENASPAKTDSNAFSKMFENAKGDFNFVDLLGMGNNTTLPTGKVEAVSAEQVSFDKEHYTGVEKAEGGNKVLNMLSDFNNQQSQMDQLVNQVLYSDKKYSNQELLAVQAHVFHLSQMTELTVKSVELGVSSFRGIMNTQIQ